MKRRVRLTRVRTTPLDFEGPPVAYTPGSVARKPRKPTSPPDLQDSGCPANHVAALTTEETKELVEGHRNCHSAHLTPKLQQIDERLAKVIEVSGMLTNIYKAVATTPKRRRMASRLASIIAWLWDGDANAGRGGAHFRNISDEQLRRELTRLSCLGENSDLVAEVKRLHQRTIVALADFGFVAVHHAGQHDLVRVVAAAERALKAHAYIRSEAKRSKPRARSSTEIAKSLPLAIARINEMNRDFWEAQKPKAKRQQLTKKKVIKGPPVNYRAAAARRILAKHYKLLTGRRPTMTGRVSDYGAPAGGQFFEFTRSVFAALNIKASPEAQTRRIAYPQRRRAK